MLYKLALLFSRPWVCVLALWEMLDELPIKKRLTCEKDAKLISQLPSESKSYRYAVALVSRDHKVFQVQGERRCIVELYEPQCEGVGRFKKVRDEVSRPMSFTVDGHTIDIQPPACETSEELEFALVERWKLKNPQGKPQDMLKGWATRPYEDWEFQGNFRFMEAGKPLPADIAGPDALQKYGFRWMGFKIESEP